MNNKRILIIIALICCFFPVVSVYSADVAKIGVVDLQRVLMASDSGKKAQADLKKQGNKMEADVKAKQNDLLKLKDRLERESMVMSKEVRDQKEREYRIKLLDLKDLQKKYYQDIKGLEARLTIRVKKEIMGIIKEMGKKGGYLLIIDKVVTYYNPNAIDVTDQVISRYNELSKKKK